MNNKDLVLVIHPLKDSIFTVLIVAVDSNMTTVAEMHPSKSNCKQIIATNDVRYIHNYTGANILHIRIGIASRPSTAVLFKYDKIQMNNYKVH